MTPKRASRLPERESQPATAAVYDTEAVNDLLRRATNVWVRRGELPHLAEQDWYLLERAMDRVRLSLRTLAEAAVPDLGTLRAALERLRGYEDSIGRWVPDPTGRVVRLAEVEALLAGMPRVTYRSNVPISLSAKPTPQGSTSTSSIRAGREREGAK